MESELTRAEPETSVLEPKPRSDYWWFVAVVCLVLAGLVSGYAFIAPGHPTSVDVWPHLSRQKVVFEALRHGASPFYSFMFYSGFPMLRFYSPLLALLGGLVTFGFGGDLVAGLKALVFGLHLVSGLTMYLYLKRRTGRTFGAAAGTLVYLMVPWRVVHEAVLAHYPFGLFYALLPLGFLALDGIEGERKLAHSMLLGLWVGLMVLAHVVYAVYAVLFMAIAFVLRLGLQQERRRYARAFGLGAGAAVGVSAFFLIPFLTEYSSHVYPVLGFIRTLPAPRLAVLLNPWSTPGGDAGVYLGLSNLVLIAGSLVLVLLSVRQRARHLGTLVGLGLGLLLVFAAPGAGTAGALLVAGLPAVRFLLFFVFFGAVLVAGGWSAVEERLGARRVWRPIALGALVLVVGADCLPQMLVPRYSRARRFLQTREEIYPIVADQGPAKVLDLHSHEDRIGDHRRLACYPSIGFVYGRMPSPYGPPYYQFAPRSMCYGFPLLNLVARDLGEPETEELSDQALKALGLLGVTHLITLPTVVSRTDDEGMALIRLKQGVDWDDRFLKENRNPPLVFGRCQAEPVLASNLVVPLPEEKVVLDQSLCVADDWQVLLDVVGMDLVGNRMSFIPGRYDQAAESLPGSASVEVLETRVKNDRLQVRFETSGDCFVRLAFSYYPELRVTLDGRPVEFFETKDHFIWLRCPEGEHEIAVTVPLGALRVATMVLSGLAFCGCIAVAARNRRKIAGETTEAAS